MSLSDGGEERRGEGKGKGKRMYPLDSVDCFSLGGCSMSHLHSERRCDVMEVSAGFEKKQK